MTKTEKSSIDMVEYKKRFAISLAETGALFFKKGLILKDGRPTPYFVNMGSYTTGKLSYSLGELFAEMLYQKGLLEKVNLLLGPSYKGSAIAQATAIALWHKYGIDIAFEYDRKEAKAHGEASLSKTLFVNGRIRDGSRIFILDDVATSMATKYELLDKIHDYSKATKISCEIVGIGIAVDREQTSPVYDENGNIILGIRGDNASHSFEKKTGIPIYSLATISEIIEFLYNKGIPVLVDGEYKPMDDETKKTFDDYMKIYGILK